MKRIAVTGGGGFLGRYVVEELARHYEVTALDVGTRHASMAYRKLDVLDLGAVTEVLRGHDAVIHLAGIDVAIEASAEAYFQTNVKGTWNVLHAAEALGHEKAVICSSVSAVGLNDLPPVHPPQYLPVDEAHPLNPTHPYGLSKQVMEVVGKSYANRGRLKVVSLRPALLIFPHIRDEVERCVQHQDSGRKVRAVAADVLSPTRSYVRPEDAARCFRLALEADTGPYDQFFVLASDTCSPEPTLAGVERRYGRLPERIDRSRYAADPLASAITNERARRILGWEPQGRWTDVLQVSSRSLAPS